MSGFRDLSKDFKDLVNSNLDTETIRRYYAIGMITFDEALRELAKVFEQLRRGGMANDN